MRVIIEHIHSGEFVDLDAEVFGLKVSHTMNGPCLISGTFPTETAAIQSMRLEPFEHLVHLEVGGNIFATGILQPGKFTAEGEWEWEAEGFSGYPYGMPYVGGADGGEYAAIEVDPLDMVRKIWAHLQSFEGGNIGVVVDKTYSTVRIGKRQENGKIEARQQSPEGPYRLAWWCTPDLGKEIADLADTTPFEFREVYGWDDANHTKTRRGIQLGYPKLGEKRENLRFKDDENIVRAIPSAQDEDLYVNQVLVLGIGHGVMKIVGNARTNLSGANKRLRRFAVVNDASILSFKRAKRIAEGELARRQKGLVIDSITVQADHDNAPLGSYAVGDDILIQARFPWLGDQKIWCRIMGFTYEVETGLVTIKLKRSDSFVDYGQDVTDDTGSQQNNKDGGTTNKPNYGEGPAASRGTKPAVPPSYHPNGVDVTNYWPPTQPIAQPNTEIHEWNSDFYKG